MRKLKSYLFVLFTGFLLLAIACDKKEEPVIIADPEPIPIYTIPQTKDIIMYEVNQRAFSESGDFQGVQNRLLEIKNLGVNVIWLMPIHPIGEVNSVNSPYSVKNYKEVNPEFGTLTNLKTLVGLAHAFGMSVILYWVVNHTAWDNPWISNTAWYTQDGNGN
ncbi:MAG: alpha-amylase, partial [Bacteroidales bacterium]|nr:alpha-amylase [Bacteroidales bacterium]